MVQQDACYDRRDIPFTSLVNTSVCRYELQVLLRGVMLAHPMPFLGRCLHIRNVDKFYGGAAASVPMEAVVRYV